MSVIDALKAHLAPIEAALDQHLETTCDPMTDTRPPARLSAAMRHSLMAGGKRLRPVLVRVVADALAGERGEAQSAPAATAIEMVHTYSLIHDDLPSMDDAPLRRGRPTSHIAFDEATAVLAGDALLTDAFAVLAQAPVRAAEQVLELARAAGGSGMVAGQMDDIAAESLPAADVDLPRIHRRKTGRLFEAACALGAIAVDATDAQIAAARAYGAALGFAFQIADDVLDVEADTATMGKEAGRDAENDKVTYVTRHGLDGAKAMAMAEAEKAIAALDALAGPGKASLQLLADLARFSATRDR